MAGNLAAEFSQRLNRLLYNHVQFTHPVDDIL